MIFRKNLNKKSIKKLIKEELLKLKDNPTKGILIDLLEKIREQNQKA